MAKARKILVVDDEPRIGDSLTFLLSHHGFATESCVSGTEAFERMKRKKYDLVLLDIVMPDLDGLSVMDFIRNQHPDTSIIFITGQATVTTAVQALRNGACDYLTKPLSETELVEAIQRVFHESQRTGLKIGDPADEFICGRCRDLLNQVTEMIFLIGSNGKFLFANRSLETAVGVKAGALNDQPWATVFMESENTAHHITERRTGKRSTCHTIVRLKSTGQGADSSSMITGDLYAVGLYSKPADDPDKVFLGTYGVIRDCSHREKVPERFLSICASCKRIRDAAGDWQSMESFFTACYPVRFSHTICKSCSKTLYPDFPFLGKD